MQQREFGQVFTWLDEAVVRYALRPDTTCLDLVVRAACRASYPLTRADEDENREKVTWHAQVPIRVATQLFRIVLLAQAPRLALSSSYSTQDEKREEVLPHSAWTPEHFHLLGRDDVLSRAAHSLPSAPEAEQRKALALAPRTEVREAYRSRWAALGAGQAILFDARLCEGYALALYQLELATRRSQDEQAGDGRFAELLRWMQQLELTPTRLTCALAILNGITSDQLVEQFGPQVLPYEEEVEYVRTAWTNTLASLH